MGITAYVHTLTARTCRRCERTASVAEFTSDRGLPSTICKLCNAELCKDRYDSNREERKAQERERRARRKAIDPETVSNEERVRWEKRSKRRKADPIAYLLAGLKSRAKRAGVPFALDRSDIFIPEHCPILGIKLRPVGTGRGDDCAEVDRLVPALGYVPGNVAVISHRANRIKNNGTTEEHERIAAWMRSRSAKHG